MVASLMSMVSVWLFLLMCDESLSNDWLLIVVTSLVNVGFIDAVGNDNDNDDDDTCTDYSKSGTERVKYREWWLGCC